MLISQAERDLIICAPWISSAGIQHLEKALATANRRVPLSRVQFWARIADVNTDSPGILKLIKQIAANGGMATVRDSSALHAKIYLADRQMALVTSANLSDAGFSTNLEAAVVLTEEDEIEQVIKMLAEIETETVVVSLEELEHFVTKQRPELVAQSIPTPPPQIIPVWMQRAHSPTTIAHEPPPVSSVVLPDRSRPVNFTDLVNWVESSLKAVQTEIQQIDLSEWVGKKARAFVCPTDVTNVLLYLRDLARIYGSGELEFGQRLEPERFTMIEGVVEAKLDNGRALFRLRRARKAKIELTKYPDRGSRSPLNNTDSRFILKIDRLD